MKVKYKVLKVENPNDLKGYCDTLVEAGYEYMISQDDPDDRMERDVSQHIYMREYGDAKVPSWIIVSLHRYGHLLIWNNYEYETRFDSEKGMIVVDSIDDLFVKDKGLDK